MGMNVGGGDNEFQSQINVTPLVDVVLVLLIIFMVIMPLTMRGYDMDIPGEPEVSMESTDDPMEQVVLGIDPENCPIVEPPPDGELPGVCEVRINDESVPVALMADRVREIFASRKYKERVLFLSADDRLNYEAVMRIVDLAKSSVEGLRIGLVTGSATG